MTGDDTTVSGSCQMTCIRWILLKEAIGCLFLVSVS
jgi:hypothetical protein